MEYASAASIKINPDDLAQLIEACKYASDRLAQTIGPVSLRGRSAQEWAHDAVSLEIAKYYDEQVYQSEYSNCTALFDYHRELGETISALQQILTDYQAVDGATAHSMEKI